jgi:glutaredoxin-like protein NrdH
MIKVYTKNNCMPCKMTKNWFKNNEVNYTEFNVEEDLEAFNELVAMDLRTLPVVFKDGELIAMGFQPQNLKGLI